MDSVWRRYIRASASVLVAAALVGIAIGWSLGQANGAVFVGIFTVVVALLAVAAAGVIVRRKS